MFGRSKKDKKTQQTQQMQVSPEALALLQAMQAGQQMQQQQMQQQMMMQQGQMQQPQMQQPQMQQPQMQQPQMQQPQMPQQQMYPSPEQMMMGQPPIGQPPMGQPQMNPEPMPQMPTNQPVMDDAALLAEIGGVNPASPQMTPQMPAGQMPAGQMPPPDMAQPQIGQPQAMTGSPQANTGFAFAPSSDATPEEDASPKAKKQKKAKLSREEKRALATQKKEEKEKKAAEKKALAKEKADEKKRAKRRKKLAKTRFSRARYLREANGNAIAGVVLWIFIILIFIAGPFMLNTAVLIPQTNENLRILTELDSLERSIVVNRPQITAMVEKRKQKQGQITAFTTSFIPSAQASESFEDLARQLEQAGLEIEPISITPFPLTATSIVGTTVSFEISGNYLDWLRVRNKFVRSHSAISIPTESVSINDETGAMQITAQIIIPSSR